MKNTGACNGRYLSHGAAIYADVQDPSQPPDYRTYSPEVTSLRSNLPVHRSVCARKGLPPRGLDYHIGYSRGMSRPFSLFFIVFLKFFWQYADAHGSGANVPPPGYFPLRYSIPDQAASASYNHVSVRCKEHRDAMHPGVLYYICPQIPQLGLQCGDHLLVLLRPSGIPAPGW